MFELSCLFTFSSRKCPEIYYYYNYFLRQFTLEGAYFFYRNNIIFVDILPGGINFLIDEENRFSLDIIDFLTLYYYKKSSKLIYKYYKRENITQIYKSYSVYAIPLNWFSPDQTISRWAADKKDDNNGFRKVFSTGYKVTSFISNIQDPLIFVLDNVIKFKNLPLKKEPDGQPLLLSNNNYQIDFPNNIEGVLVYPLNLTSTSKLTISPYITGFYYTYPNTYVLNENGFISNENNINIILNNNITDLISATITPTNFNVDIMYETTRALIGGDTLFYDNNKAYKQYFIGDLKYGFFDIATSTVIPSQTYKTLTIAFPTTPGAINGLTLLSPNCLNYDSSFTFIFYSLIGNIPTPTTSSSVANFTSSWNYYTININTTFLTVGNFLVFSPLSHACVSYTNGITTKSPQNIVCKNNTLSLPPDVLNTSSYITGNNNILNYYFINNNFDFTCNDTVATNVNASTGNNPTLWITSSNAAIQLVLGINALKKFSSDIANFNNFIFMEPSGLIPFYYLNFEQTITTTIRTDTTLIDEGDGYLYSKEIYIPNTIFVPNKIGFNIYAEDEAFPISNVIECNTQIRRNILWYPWTFINYNKSYFTFKKMDKNPFKIRILKNQMTNFNVKLMIYIDF